MQKRLARADVPVDMTWDLGDLFASEAAWETEFATLLSIKTGGCPEDCGYCPQSVHYCLLYTSPSPRD